MNTSFFQQIIYFELNVDFAILLFIIFSNSNDETVNHTIHNIYRSKLYVKEEEMCIDLFLYIYPTFPAYRKY